jgi:hypothetical protein
MGMVRIWDFLRKVYVMESGVAYMGQTLQAKLILVI